MVPDEVEDAFGQAASILANKRKDLQEYIEGLQRATSEMSRKISENQRLIEKYKTQQNSIDKALREIAPEKV